MRTLSSRERVARTFCRDAVDRIAVDYSANSQIDRKLKRHFGLSDDDTEALLQVLQVDFRELQIPYAGPVLHPPLPGRRVDPAWGIITRWVSNQFGGYWDFCDFPLREMTPETAESWPMPSPDDYDYDSIADALRRWPDKSVYLGNPGLGDILNTTGMLCGMEAVLTSLALGDPSWQRLVDRRLDVQLEVSARALEKAEGRVDFMWMGEDLGTQNGPMISPQMYKTVLKPRHRKFVELAQSHGIPVMIHSCGSSSWAFPDFLDLGISAVDTIQPEAADMAPRFLKDEFGDRLSFHGGLSTAGSLVSGNRDEALAELKDLLEIMMPGGGYFFSTTHQIQDNTPVENIISVYEAVLRQGRY